MLRLAAVSDAVARVFSPTVLDPVFAVYADVGRALAADRDRRDIVRAGTGGPWQSMERQII
ncbi:hypothetical protein [Streptomyces sp. NPDC007172]|uniref:hypothetical protein n=1 Tax=Streptomyces sp. NPDC007172 TaxID=3364776 RepID=UPI0036C4A7B2